MPKRLNTKTFVKKAIEIHGDKYIYDKTTYINSKSNLKITCKKHGDFQQLAQNHLQGQGCPFCALEEKQKPKFDTEKWIQKAIEIQTPIRQKHNLPMYDYCDTEYFGSEYNVIIECPIHGKFSQLAQSHLKGCGCQKCGILINKNNLSKSTESFIIESNILHNNKYNYSKTNYVNSYSPVIINCLTHGEFKQLPINHLQGKGCPKCNNLSSKPEKEILEFIKSIYSGIIIENDRRIIYPNELDIYLPECNLAIEFDGIFWHSENYKPKDYHLQKTIDCEINGVQLIHIFEDEWFEKRKIIESRLRQLIGVNNKRIYARDCYIKQPSPKEERLFLNNNHLQGYIPSNICYGLYYFSKETNKEYLVSLMSFGSLRKNLGSLQKDSVYEMYRFANITNFSVIGGASKIFKHFIKRIKPFQVISFADRRWSSTVRKQTLYDALGFHFQNNTEVNYYYIQGTTRINRFAFRKDVLVSKGYDALKTEKEITEEIGLSRIYDCGNLKYVYQI